MRLRSSLVAVALAAAVTLAACGGGGGSGTSTTDGESNEPVAGAALTIAKPDGAISTESNNPFVADSAAAKYGYHHIIFEPLGIVNFVGDNKTTPWLAETIEWNDDYTELTVTAREGVTWSDGEPFTVDDIVYTFDLVSTPEFDTSNLQFEGSSVDGNTVTLSFGESKFVKIASVMNIPIVPKHIWENIADPKTDPITGDNLVGTGPYVMENWSTQSVTLTARDDYWGGDLAVPTLYFVSYNDNTALATALAQEEADWAQAFIPKVQETFVDVDPEHNVFWAAPVMAETMLMMNTQEKPFNDVAFRQAAAWIVDRDAYAQIAREGASEPVWSVTGLPSSGEQYVLDEYKGQNYSVDVDKAKQILTDAGYTWDGDALIDPDGEPVTFTIEVPQGWNDYVTGISLIADQFKESLGVDAKVNTPDVDTWWANKTNGDFDAILHWTDTGTTPYDIYSDTMDERWLLDDGTANYNLGRFRNPEATAALNAYATASTDEDRNAALATIQEIFVEEVPAIGLGTHGFLSEYNTRNYVGWPGPDNQYAVGDPLQTSIVQILTKLEPAQ